MKNNKEWWIKFIAISILVVFWIVIIWLNSAKDIDLKYFWIIGGIISIGALIYLFGKDLAKLKKKQVGMPKAISKEDCYKLIEKEIEDRWNNKEKITCIHDKAVNKNIIYAFKVKMNLDDEGFIIIINSNYSDRIPTILPHDALPEEIWKAINDKSMNPFEEPDRTKIRRSVDPFGKPIEEIEEIKHKEVEKEKDEGII